MASTAPGAAAAPEASEMASVASALLSDLLTNNPPEAINSSAKILTTLLRNAAASAEGDAAAAKRGSVRLSNPKIQQHVVNVRGAVDLLCAAGFVSADGGQRLSYIPPVHDPSARAERTALIEALCLGLEGLIAPPAAAAGAGAAASVTAASSGEIPSKSNDTFLGQKERQERVDKIRAAKKAKKAQRAAAKERWNEDAEERKAAAARREAALNSKVQKDVNSGDFRLAKDVRLGGGAPRKGGMLPKPFEEAGPTVGTVGIAGGGADAQEVRRRMIQMCMKDESLTAPERQAMIQGLMRMGDGALLAAAAASSDGDAPASDALPRKSDDPMDEKGTGMDERKQPPAAAKEPPGFPSNKELLAARAPTPPSAEWTAFLRRVPRCAGAEGIRDTSVFRQKAMGAAFETAIPKCLKRLFKELDGLKEDLPSEPNCSIFLRFDEETPQFIRALISAPLPGPTPYSGGLFVFDIYVPNDYPQSNPKVQLRTTGGGRVRFGPNLYADGKVCLSLLGTWSGPKWSPKHSSLYQVLISIQGLILGVEHPYYLEPGHGGWEGDVKDGKFQVTGQTLAGAKVQQEVGLPLEVILYEDVLRVGTVKFAMAQHLRQALEGTSSGVKSGLEPFSEIILAHFGENRTSILAEVRNWMDDVALGRNRSKALGKNAKGSGVLQIDSLRNLLPKLEALLDRASVPQSSDDAEVQMDVEEEDSKPAARPSKEDRKPAASSQPAAKASGLDAVEQKKQEMQDAATKGDFILAGKIQEEVNRLEGLQLSMKEAVQQNDFIRAGRLQAQFKALTQGNATSTASKVNANQQSTSTWENDNDSDGWSDEEEEEEDGMDWSDDEDMGGMGPPPGMGMGPPHGLGSNVFAPPGKCKSNAASKHHSWGTGQTLSGTVDAKKPAAKAKETQKAAPNASIPPEQLCRLRFRLPQDKSVVEDFNKESALAEVYRRLEPLVPEENGKRSAVASPSVPGGAFSQPLSSVGFTLLLARPKREFSLEMHGTKSLLELNLAPSATLTVMHCRERGVMYRGEVESRLNAAQGDAMDVEGLTYEGLMELQERVGKAAPKDGAAFLTLTKEDFDASTEKVSPATYLACVDASEDRQCSICLGEYDASDNTHSLRKVKSCGHVMHSGCLQTWLQTNSSCPLCKTPLVGDAVKEM
ncbi:hypothetical protein ACHAXT_005737 [Thalassiosira profunda]